MGIPIIDILTSIKGGKLSSQGTSCTLKSVGKHKFHSVRMITILYYEQLEKLL